MTEKMDQRKGPQFVPTQQDRDECRKAFLESCTHGEALDWMNNFRVAEMVPDGLGNFKFVKLFYDRFETVELAERFKKGRAVCHHGNTDLLWVIPVWNRHKNHKRMR